VYKNNTTNNKDIISMIVLRFIEDILIGKIK